MWGGRVGRRGPPSPAFRQSCFYVVATKFPKKYDVVVHGKTRGFFRYHYFMIWLCRAYRSESIRIYNEEPSILPPTRRKMDWRMSVVFFSRPNDFFAF